VCFDYATRKKALLPQRFRLQAENEAAELSA